MALNINGRMKVKTLRADFKKEFGLTLRVYDGRSFADDDATLASIRKGDSVGGEFAPQRNTKVGNLEDKIMDMFGIKTQVAGSDDSYLCDNDHTLAKALEADEKLMVKREKRNDKPANSDTQKTVELEIVDDDMFEDDDDFNWDDDEDDINDSCEEEEVVFIRADGEVSPEDEDFLQLAVALKIVKQDGKCFEYMYAVGQPFDIGATYFKCDLETGKKWKGIDSWEWASIEDEEGNSLGEDLETDSNDRPILDELREKISEWVLHASEIDDDDPEDNWYIKKEKIGTMTEESEEDDNEECSVLFYRSNRETVYIENMIDHLDSMWEYNIGQSWSRGLIY